MQNKNKTVVKTMDILNLFVDHPRLSLNEMVELSGIPKTSIHRMIGSLESMGLLTKDKEFKYSLGLTFLQFGQLVAQRLDVREIAIPYMKELRDQVNEAVNLIIQDGKEAIYVEKIDTIHPVRLYTQVGRRSPLYAGACSRIILAFMDDEEQEGYIQELDLTPIGKGTITDRNQLRQVLADTRKNGYTLSRSELENDTFAIAAPIFNHHRRPAAGLSIAGPLSRLQEERIPELADQVINAAREISVQLGYQWV